MIDRLAKAWWLLREWIWFLFREGFDGRRIGPVHAWEIAYACWRIREACSLREGRHDSDP